MLKILWIIKMEWQTFKTENAHMECQDQVFYTFSYEKKKKQQVLQSRAEILFKLECCVV